MLLCKILEILKMRDNELIIDKCPAIVINLAYLGNELIIEIMDLITPKIRFC
jgi:hypothetical protein